MVTYDIADHWTAGFSLGYEYIPSMDISNNGLGAEIDFTSFTLGVNVLWRF
jgi:hypothetical protein